MKSSRAVEQQGNASSGFKVVLVANDHPFLPDWVPRKMVEAGIEFDHNECHNRGDLEKCATDADVLWLMSSRKGLVVEDNMDVFERLGAVIKCGSGTDNIDHDACTKRGIIVAHTPEDATEPASDHAIAMLFAAVRQISRQDRLVRQGVWNPDMARPIGLLTGASVGLIGFGRIGRTIARKLSGFITRIHVYDPYLDDADVEAAGATKVDIEDLLSQSQFVIVSCPLTEQTRGLLGEKQFRMMRSDAVLVNCARAAIVDQISLERALREGWIKAAAVDVLESPLKPGDGLLMLENITFTPHMGGYTHDPCSAFHTPVDVIIGMSKMRLPRWIVNREVIPKWNMS